MANTITLYLSRNYQQTRPIRQYWLTEKTEFYDGETAEFILPDGFMAAESKSGETLIYDENQYPFPRSGGCFLIGTARQTPYLYPAEYGADCDAPLKRNEIIFLKRAQPYIAERG